MPTHPPSPRSPRLLVSVRDASEAIAALAGGADIIDVKEPSHGPLGMADPHVTATVVAAVAGRALVTAAMGELADPPQWRPVSGLAMVKIGLARAPREWPVQLTLRFSQVEPAQPVAVAYADSARAHAPAPTAVLAWARHNATGILIDTCIKDGRGLFEWLGDNVLEEFIRQAHDDGLLVALAGGLRIDDVARCTALGADIVAVRGAACRDGDRGAQIDTAQVKALAALLATQTVAEGRTGN